MNILVSVHMKLCAQLIRFALFCLSVYNGKHNNIMCLKYWKFLWTLPSKNRSSGFRTFAISVLHRKLNQSSSTHLNKKKGYKENYKGRGNRQMYRCFLTFLTPSIFAYFVPRGYIRFFSPATLLPVCSASVNLQVPLPNINH